MSMRARAAPAPSGELHVGNVRTFIFNWLTTRHSGGSFILRIEDTDKQRFTEEAYEAALRDLRWLGLDWDEGPEVGGDFGPYRQSQRTEMHKQAAEKLLQVGAAYRCFCTPEELDVRRKQALAEKRKPGYDGRCYRLTPEERASFEEQGRPSAVRFHVPDEGMLIFTDLVVGEVKTSLEEIDDFVILRSDGSPLYQLGVVVDDAHMKVTHVIRGDDHLSNTPKQILLHDALGNEPPVFAHVPQVFGPDRKPLSKRHGSTSVSEFRESGYLPEALFNYLSLLGWGTAEDTILSKEDLISRFRIEDVHPSPAMFDFKKCEWMNGEYIRMLGVEDLASRITPWLQNAGIIETPPTDEEKARLMTISPLIQTRIRLLSEAAGYARPLLRDVEIDEEAFAKVMSQDHIKDQLTRSRERLDRLDPWDRDGVEEALREVQVQMDLKPKTAFAPFYVAISGGTVGAPVFDSMAVLGKKESLRRIDAVLARI